VSNPTTSPPEDVVTLMIVPGQAGSIRRFHIPRVWVKRATLAGVGLSIALLALGRAFVLVLAPLIAIASTTLWTLDHPTDGVLDLAVPIACALVIVVASAPYTARLLRSSRGRPSHT